MKHNRWIAFPLAGLVALVIGVVVVEAATPSPSPSSSNYAQVFIDKLAKILGLSSTKTQDALKQAQLQTIDQMLKDGRITQAQADALKNRINAGAGPGLGFGFPFRHGDRFGARGLLQDVRTAEVNAVASALKMSTSDLQTQLRSGKSLADLEQAKGVSDSTVRKAEHDAAKKVLDPAVKAGTITQSQEDAILAKIDRGSAVHGFGSRSFYGEPEQEPAPNL